MAQQESCRLPPNSSGTVFIFWGAFSCMSFTALPLNPQAQPAIPHAEQAMEDLDLALRLGPPGGGSHLNIDWDALEELHSPAYQPQLPPSPFRLPTTLEEIRNRLVLENMRFPQNLQRPLAEAEQLVQLKSQIIETMATLDEETFWVQNPDSLIRNSLLHRDRITEYDIQVLSRFLNEFKEFENKSFLYSELIRTRREYERFFEYNTKWDFFVISIGRVVSWRWVKERSSQ